MSVCLSVCLYVCLSVHPSVRPSVCPSICPSVCPSVRPSVHLSLCDVVLLFLFAADEDYVAADEALFLPAGSNNGDQVCLNISILNDGVDEEQEMFSVKAALEDGVSPSDVEAAVAIGSMCGIKIPEWVGVREEILCLGVSGKMVNGGFTCMGKGWRWHQKGVWCAQRAL